MEELCMIFDRSLMWSSVATKHLLEARLHLLAAMEAMADMEGFAAEHGQVKKLRSSLDELFLAVEDKTMEMQHRLKEEEG
jgi:hypothetical protein